MEQIDENKKWKRPDDVGEVVQEYSGGVVVELHHVLHTEKRN